MHQAPRCLITRPLYTHFGEISRGNYPYNGDLNCLRAVEYELLTQNIKYLYHHGYGCKWARNTVVHILEHQEYTELSGKLQDRKARSGSHQYIYEYYVNFLHLIALACRIFGES